MIFYRTSPAEFIVPFDKYMDSVKNNCTIGLRFKMRFEGEEAPEQRYDFFFNLACNVLFKSNKKERRGGIRRESG